MEYLDGEGAADSRSAIGTHLAGCAACQAIAAEQRGISENAKAWTVAPAPSSLRAPAPPQARVRSAPLRVWRPSRVAIGVLGAAAVVVIVVALGSRADRTREVSASAKALTIPRPSASEPVRVAGNVERLGLGRGGGVGGVAGGLSQAPAPLAGGRQRAVPFKASILRRGCFGRRW